MSGKTARRGMLSNRSLRFRLIAAFLIVTMVAVGIVTFFSDRTVRTGLTQDVGQSLKSLAVSKAQEVGSLLTNQVNILHSFALNDVVHTGVETANATYVGEAAAIQAEIDRLDQQWRAADAAGSDADPLVQAHLNNEMAEALRRFRESFPSNVEVFVTDVYGALIASTNRTSDYYQADEEWWQVAYNDGQGDVYIGQPEFDESSATFSVNIAVPLHAPDSQSVIGVLRTTLDIGALQTILAQTGHAGLLLPSGELIRPEGGLAPAEPETLSHVQDLSSADYAEFVFDGDPSLVSQAPVTSIDPKEAAIIDQLGWTFLVAQNSAIALGPVNAAAQTTLLTGIGTLLAAALLALGMAQVLVRPITRLTAVAEKVAGGDLRVQAHVESGDEIGTLATTFNSMTSQLRETLENLERRVNDRTKALTTSTEVSRRLSTILDQKQLVAEVVEQVQAAFNYYHAHIYLFDESQENLVMVGGTGEAGAAMLARGHKLPADRGLVGRAAETNTVVLVPDTAADPGWLPNPLLPETHSEVAVPIAYGDQVLGVLDVQHHVAGGLKQEDADLLQSIANQVAIAVRNAQAYTQAQQQAYREKRINRISEKIQSAATIEDVLQITARELGQVLNTRRAQVELSMASSRANGNEVIR